MRRVAIIAIALSLVAVGVAVGASTANRFSDVAEDHWAISYMEWADDAGIITSNADGAFRPSEKVSRAQVASYFYKYDQYRTSTDMSIAEADRFFNIFGAELNDEWHETSAGFDEAYTLNEVAALVRGLCATLGDTPANASLRETRDVIANWLGSVEWQSGVTALDKWRVVFYGHDALCPEYRSVFDVWEGAGWPPLDFS